MTARSVDGARLSEIGSPATGATPAMVVLVLHGGPEHGTARCHRWLPQVVRCRLLARAVVRRWPTRRVGEVAVYLLQHAWTGWDGDGRDAIADARWAVRVLAQRHPHTPVAILGHSMGGRVGVRVAGADNVVGVVGLAPWLPANDPVKPLRDRRLSAIQGSRDHELPASTTAAFLARATAFGVAVRRREIRGGGHAMLFRMGRWSACAVTELAGLVPGSP